MARPSLKLNAKTRGKLGLSPKVPSRAEGIRTGNNKREPPLVSASRADGHVDGGKWYSNVGSKPWLQARFV
ncbi:hypothetical protein ACJ73_03252 [Blastomyces percursus]|uniref:Uncharacterized protein n=1 Tax=Blastomyces percursus TaxID=1658174 RepID=A0A1J9RA28_9EURO|nr:hypothetical protein ACJ73_03252 [Blastomyces percursus]